MAETSAREQKRIMTRERMLDAAERLLRADGDAAFSMRDLAAEAGVSFATPFNHFGSKAAIAQALSARRIDLMRARFLRTEPSGDAIERVLAAVSIAVTVLLEEPQINRAIIRSLGFPGVDPSEVSAQSQALWTVAFADGDGVDPNLAKVAVERVPEQLAIGFRGCLSFWIADEITDVLLPEKARMTAITILLGFVPTGMRADLLGA